MFSLESLKLLRATAKNQPPGYVSEGPPQEPNTLKTTCTLGHLQQEIRRGAYMEPTALCVPMEAVPWIV